MGYLLLSLLPLMAAPPADKLADLVGTAVHKAAEPFMNADQTLAMSIGVFKDGRSFTYNFGVTEPGARRSPSMHTRYFIGSITKTFTGILLAKAVREGKVSLDDDVRKHLDGDYPNLEFQGEPIRLWQLLNHTSGLPRDFPPRPDKPEPDYARIAGQDNARMRAYTAEEFLRDLHVASLTRTPGVKFSYSNVAAQLLGLLLEKVYGKSYDALIKEKIAGPLGMRDTKVALSPREIAEIPRAASFSGTFLPASSTRLPAAGSLKSSTSDMLKYLAWNIAETDDAVRLAHRRTGNTDWGSSNFYVGLNWQILTGEGQRMIFQDGYLPGFHSMCLFCPERHIGIVVLSSEKVRATPTRLSPLIDQILKRIDPGIMSTP
ncbi:beta-lactamase family protein [Fimbriimonas ginsengisoli Gsoil 348]|uniref:Beta-lactamase family protein n=2 Tax=Fimbriimonas ginsengisoli TaxID=1005039 RepID=A0A068NNP3_FIMGI|nr:beta-lactamase family protein [Fimbriimonas ginsengisoli Gsoil 348]